RCVVAARREDDGDDAERDDERAGGYHDVQPPGLLEAALEPHSSPVPPPIRKPISSTDAVFASSSPAIPPSYLTTTRSARPRLSSRPWPTPRPATPFPA